MLCLLRPSTRTLSFRTFTCLSHRPQLISHSWSSKSPRLFSTAFRRRTPPHRRSSVLDRIPHNFIIYGILGLNGVVFAMWYLAVDDYRMGNPSKLKWMHENFAMSFNNLRSSRIWCLVTSCFSHSGVGHLFFNCFTFYFMAPPVLSILGARSFIALYMGGGIFANVLSSSYNNLVKHRDIQSVGASAAIYAVVSFLACVAPRTSFLIYGIIPVPAWLLVTGLFAFDTWSSFIDRRTTTDTMGHVGGILSGVGYYIARRFGIFRL